MEFNPEQTAYLTDIFNELVRVTNKGKNEALKAKNGNLAAAFLAQNQGVREFAARVFDDETIADPEQCPFLVI